MSKCLQCGTELPPKIEGKRPRLYCDNNGACKQKHWQKNKKAKTHVTIPIEKYNELETQLSELLSKSLEENKEEFNKALNDITEKGLAITHTTENGKVRRIDEFSEEGQKAKAFLNQIPPMPIKEKGENSFDYAARKNEWKKKYNQT